MNDQPFEIIHQNGYRYVFDIGRIGYDFYDALKQLLLTPRGGNPEFMWVADFLYRMVVDEVVRLLGESPIDVIEILKVFPPPNHMDDIIMMIEVHEYEPTILICREYATKLYLHLRPQLPNEPPDLAYIPNTQGSDYVVVQSVYATKVHGPDKRG